MKIKYWGTVFWEKFQQWFSFHYHTEFNKHASGSDFTKKDLYRAYYEGFRQGRLRGRRESREEIGKGVR